MNNIEPEKSPDRLDFAVEIAREAGQRTLRLFRDGGLQVERKSDGSPVTLADRDAEEHLRERIRGQFPDDGIVGEEFGTVDGKSGFRWVLDPIDGTKSFIGGVPLYTTLVAVLRDDEPLVGVIYAPATDEILYAQTGSGCCWYAVGGEPPRQARVSQVSELAEALFVTTDVEAFSTDRSNDARAVYDQLASACRIARTWGDAYGYLLVATGRAEVMIDPKLSLWDVAALEPIVTEAGGSFADWQGQRTIHSGEAVATNAALAEQVLAFTRGK